MLLPIRKQRVVVDAIVTDYLNINRGVSQGTVLGPILFSIMVNDIKVIAPSRILDVSSRGVNCRF